MLTKGHRHSLRDQIGTLVVNFFELVKQEGPGKNGAVHVGGNGALTKLVCGGMVFENRVTR